MTNTFSITGTHDIQNVTIESLQPSEIRVKGDFIDQAMATGVLMIIYSLNNDADIQYIETDNGSEQDFDVTVTGLIGTEYGVSIFALENGLPFPRVVTMPKDTTVASDKIHGLWAMHGLANS